MSASESGPNELPDGLDEYHTQPHRGPAKHASVLSVILLGAILATAATGVLGGRTTTIARENAAINAEIEVPTILRNGEFFEMRIKIDARRRIDKLGLGVGSQIWRDVTLNTMIPAAAQETYQNGAYLLTFGRIESGSRFVVKVDAQINPSRRGAAEGPVDILDGNTVLLSVPLRIKVLP